MKKKIILGSIFTVVLLLLLPSTSAVGTDAVLENNKSSYIENLKEMAKEVKDLQIIVKNIGREELQKQVKKIDQVEFKEKINSIYKELLENIGDPPTQPQCIAILTILKLILQTISTIVGLIYLPISIALSLIFFVISFIISLPFRVVQFVINILIKIIDNIIDLIQGVTSNNNEINSIIRIIEHPLESI